MNVPELRFSEFEGEWEIDKFGKYMNIKSGYGFKASEYSKNGIPLIKIDNVSYGKVIWENTSYLPHDYLDKYPDLSLKEEDILLALNRPITRNKLKIAFLRMEDSPSILYQRVGKIIINNELNKKFIFYLLSKYIFTFVLKTSVGSDQPFISVVELKKMHISLPSIQEQEKIASFLSKVDEKIEKLERKEELWQTYKKGMMQQIFSQSLRFKDDDGNDYPDWEEKNLEKICSIQMGHSPSSKNYTENSDDTVLIQGNADLSSGKVIPRLYTTEITKISNPGDIIMTVRAPVGDLAFNDYFACIGRGVCAIKGNKFTYYLLEQLRESKVWNKISQGSTFEAVSSSDIKNLKIKIPALLEQEKISQFLSAIDKKIENIQKELEINKEFKKGLLQQMFPSDKKSEDIKTKDLSKLHDKQAGQTALL